MARSTLTPGDPPHTSLRLPLAQHVMLEHSARILLRSASLAVNPDASLQGGRELTPTLNPS